MSLPSLVESQPRQVSRPGLVLLAMCLSVFAVNVDTTIVNITLPTLVTELGATTRELQWIVDAYLLAFAALVLAGGSLSDRLGRRAVLTFGLTVFGLANLAASFCDTPEQLIAARAVAGIGAAAAFPTTLSIISQVYRERAARARAIGIWGAVGGLAVAFGPITGGALLEEFPWGSTFLVKAPLAVLAIVLVALVVPESKDPAAPRFDVPGLLLSALGLVALVYTIIEGPKRGWDAPETLIGFAVAAALFIAFVGWERKVREPMLDLALFADRRFTASALAITVAFFALFGFIFLITQYFQFLRGYSPLESGVRILPVAIAIATGSVAGTILAVRLGNKLIVTTGLLFLAVAFAWASTVNTATSYIEIAAQMVFLGLGLGLTSAPATEAVMGAVQTDKAGIGSAVNDATREVGGTLGVAVIGSVFASLYTADIEELASTLPPGAGATAADSIGAAVSVVAQLPPGQAELLFAAAESGFYQGLQAGCLVASGVAVVGAIVAAIALPARPTTVADDTDPPSESTRFGGHPDLGLLARGRGPDGPTEQLLTGVPGAGGGAGESQRQDDRGGRPRPEDQRHHAGELGQGRPGRAR